MIATQINDSGTRKRPESSGYGGISGVIYYRFCGSSREKRPKYFWNIEAVVWTGKPSDWSQYLSILFRTLIVQGVLPDSAGK